MEEIGNYNNPKDGYVSRAADFGPFGGLPWVCGGGVCAPLSVYSAPLSLYGVYGYPPGQLWGRPDYAASGPLLATSPFLREPVEEDKYDYYCSSAGCFPSYFYSNRGLQSIEETFSPLWPPTSTPQCLWYPCAVRP